MVMKTLTTMVLNIKMETRESEVHQENGGQIYLDEASSEYPAILSICPLNSYCSKNPDQEIYRPLGGDGNGNDRGEIDSNDFGNGDDDGDDHDHHGAEH